MKRLLTILGILLAGLAVFGWLRSREQSLALVTKNLEAQAREWQSKVSMAKAEQQQLRDTLTKTKRRADAATGTAEPFSLRLAQWLAAGNFSTIPAGLVPELLGVLGLAEDRTGDYVWISKPTMQTLRPGSPGQSDKLSERLCGLLAIGPEQRAQVESALSNARKEFADWAKQNVARETPREHEVVRYKLPAATDFAEGVTNRLLASISNSIGAERSSLFRTYADTWFQIEMGYLGGVTNTLAVSKIPDEKGQERLYYKLSREGQSSSMSEGPAKINPRWFPPAWRNIFPGGWAEVAELEGLQLPEEVSNR